MTFKHILLLLILFVIDSSSGREIDLCSTDAVKYNYYNEKVVVDCNCDSFSACIRRCCRHGFQYYPSLNLCEANRLFHTSSLDFHYSDGERLDLYSSDKFRIGMLKCTAAIYLEADGNLDQNGSLHLADGILSPRDYCINNYWNSLLYYVCPGEYNKGNMIEKELAYVGELISIPFLLATFLIYLLLPERSIHRNALIFHSLSLTLYNILFALSQYFTVSYVNKHHTLCILSGCLRLYFKSAAYFWVNGMCLDTLLAVRGVKEVRTKSEKKSVYLIIFSIYAWGIPGLFILIVLLGKGINDYDCYLKAPRYHPFDFYPGAVIYLFNVVLFVLITIYIKRARKRDARLIDDDSKSNSIIDDEFVLYWNLFFIMGYLTFDNLIGLIEVLLLSDSSETYNRYLSYFRAIINSTYGIGIFILYVCRKNTRNAIKERYYQITGKLEEDGIKINP